MRSAICSRSPSVLPGLGSRGREHVKENLPMTTDIRRWLLLLRILLSRSVLL